MNAVAGETGGALRAMAVMLGVAGCIDERAAEGVGKGAVAIAADLNGCYDGEGS